MIPTTPVLLVCLLAQAPASPAEAPRTPALEAANPPAALEAFPHVRLDRSARTVELDGVVPIRLDDPRAPRVYLELIACTPDTKEHESLVVTKAKPSHVHAALLAIGLTPGVPATWRTEGTRTIPVPPTGSPLRMSLVFLDGSGAEVEHEPAKWIINAKTNESWPEGPFVFAGSVMKTRQGREMYEADGSGTLIGLASFGTEVIAWPGVISPDSQIDEPEWIADVRHVPPMNTPVRIRLRAMP